MPTWVESSETGDYLLTSNFDPSITTEDERLLNALEWSKIGFYKTKLTKMNGGQANEIRER